MEKSNSRRQAGVRRFQFFSILFHSPGQGSNESALVQPNSMVISKSFSRKYFGDANPIGQSLEVGLRKAVYKVTGVFDEVPANSHFHPGRLS
jgi:putative ABC transport system permease protein